MRLLPYFYSAFADYHRKGMPPVRSMLLESKDLTTELKEDNSQFMFGPSMLVAPFYERQATERAIRLPQGNWYDFYTGEFVGNGTEINRTNAEMKDRVPLFVKEGSVIPMLSKAVLNTDAAYGLPLELRHYGKEPGTFALYEDDGKTFDYERGAYRVRKLVVEQGGSFQETVVGDGPTMFGAIERLRQMTESD